MKKIVADYYFIVRMLEHIEKNSIEMQPKEINIIIKTVIEKNELILSELKKQMQ